MHVDERNVQTVIDYFKQYLAMADRGYRSDLEQEAKIREQELRQQLAREKEEIERKARVLKSIKF